MAKFLVTLRSEAVVEVVGEIEVEADTEEDAMEKAADMSWEVEWEVDGYPDVEHRETEAVRATNMDESEEETETTDE